MSVFEPVFRPIFQPVSRALCGPSVGSSLDAIVQRLFASGEKGVMFDFTRAANLYQDAERTTLVAATNDQIGSATDLSPNGKHATSAGTARPKWDSAGYATWDAFDDYLQTAAIDFSATDKITIIASLRKLTDSVQIIAELSATVNSNPGSFWCAVDSGGRLWASQARGDAAVSNGLTAYDTTPAPDTAVLAIEHDIAGDLSRLRRNGVAGADGVANKGNGNFGNYALNIGARATSSLLFNGRIYRLLVIGRALTTTERNAAERWAAQPVGIVIP